MNQFLVDTFSTYHFSIHDVIADNACMYRAVAVYMYMMSPYHRNDYILSKRKWGIFKDIEKLPLMIDETTIQNNSLSKKIHELTYDYIIKHMEYPINMLGDILVKDAIPMIHNISCDEYIKYYKFFPNSDIGQNFEFDLWGSTLEQWAISEIFQIPIIVFTSQRWDEKKLKVCNGKIIKGKPNKNVRLKVLTVIGSEFISDDVSPIYLIWRNHNRNGHYLACFPKNENIKNMI